MQRRRSDSSRKQNARLPAIAPKEEQPPPAGSSLQAAAPLSSIEIDLPRTRLYPRSRTGCWTCRQRKVKCDEQKPTCGQCERLGHRCDYSARLSFRDDTARVVEKMQEVKRTGSAVWDPQTVPGEGRSTSPVEDTLPPFAALTNDEDRELKAKSRDPGTFHVIVNPESFSDLDEYREDAPQSPSPTVSPPHEPAENLFSSLETGDPAVVILRRFEDVLRRPAMRSSGHHPRVRLSASRSPSSPAKSLSEESQPVQPQRSDPASATVAVHATTSLEQTVSDSSLQEHYQFFIRPRIASIRQQAGFPEHSFQISHSGKDIFEEQAAIFPPLHHAIMALAAVSIAHRTGVGGVEALQYYQQALPSLQESLQSPQDIVSDGALFTHFFLLLCEIAAAEIWASNLWEHHLSQLYRIILARRQILGHEPHTFLLWWICCIDAHAILSGNGNASFIGAMARNELLTLPEWLSGRSGISVNSLTPQEQDLLPPIVEFNRKMIIIAASFGQVGRELQMTGRTEVPMVGQGSSSGDVHWGRQQGRMMELRARLHRLWDQEMPLRTPANWAESIENFPSRMGTFVRHTCLLYHACILYSHTRMWASQQPETPLESLEEVSRSAAEILQLTSRAAGQNQLVHPFTVFPIFMAGVASSRAQEKMLALNLLRTLEQDCIGGSTKGARQLLEAVYDQQNESLQTLGRIVYTDWLQVMADKRLQVVFLGI